ncbi:MAG TPA: cellulase family glycosylhydrolase [Bacteroidota bacterium]|nr:cellulase family glycosylhydrolase [Bacteroidota bacterium]
MKSSRREFVKTIAGACLVATTPIFAYSHSGLQKSRRAKGRILAFSDPHFPSVENVQLDRSSFQSTFDEFDTRVISAHEIEKTLDPSAVDLFITAHGSAFPRHGMSALFRYLRAGGNWINLGGTPLGVPVSEHGGNWQPERPETVFHKSLGITQSFVVPVGEGANVQPNPEIPDINIEKDFSCRSTRTMYYRLTANKDFPQEDGSAGTRDAIVRPLLWLVSSDGLKIAAPVVEIDRMLGEFAGGRWIFVTAEGLMTSAAIRALAHRAIHGAVDFHARPVMASYEAGEAPQIFVELRRPGGNLGEFVNDECQLEIVDGQGNPAGEGTGKIAGADAFMTAYISPSFPKPLAPGLYRVRALQRLSSSPPAGNTRLMCTTGFWIRDPTLLEGGKSYTADSTYLRCNGEPYPITGSTYMGSDVHRKFLLEPNPARWDDDFRSMKDSGINMVRTGIWTGWRNIMPDPGEPNIAALRSIDAFLMTARKYNIPVLFTFFAFIPESWGGANAYLDPRSQSAQKEFISSIVTRYRKMNDVMWDLINEPSFCNPGHLWSCRPNYDRFESQAWADWVSKQIANVDSTERANALRERFGLGEDDNPGLPAPEDFEEVNIGDTRRPKKAIEYRLFAQEMFRRWVKEMQRTISESARSAQLVTVGQDEAGTNDSPNNQFFGGVVDFTSVHNWWLNDDLIWDCAITKVPGKANLVEETGVMFYERSDGSALRNEEEVRNLLERKMAIAYGTGSAGFIEWIWNTNPFMKSDNEAAIGLIRADGSVKPEYDSVRRFARFIRENAARMVNRQSSEVLLVIPHLHMFSPRNEATAATQRCVRVLAEEFSLVPDAVSDHELDSIRTPYRLILLPYPNLLASEAWTSLLRLVEAGAILVVSGPVDQYDIGTSIEEAPFTGSRFGRKPVAEIERIGVEDSVVEAQFWNLKGQRVEKAVDLQDGRANVRTVSRGKGMIVWSMVPVEASDDPASTAALYKYAARTSALSFPLSFDGGRAPVTVLPVVFQDFLLLVGISESDTPAEIAVTLSSSGQKVQFTVPAQRVTLLVIETKSGRIISSLF